MIEDLLKELIQELRSLTAINKEILEFRKSIGEELATARDRVAGSAPAATVAETPASTKPAAKKAGKTKSEPAPEPEPEPEAPAAEETEDTDDEEIEGLEDPEPEVTVTHEDIRAFHRNYSAANKDDGDKVAAFKKLFVELSRKFLATEDGTATGKPALTKLPADKCGEFLAELKAKLG